MQIKDKKISILGIARSGKALVKVLIDKGANLLLSDIKSYEQLKGVVDELSDFPLKWETGGHTDKVYKGRDMIVISPGVSINTPILREAIDAGVEIMSEVEMAFLLSKARFIAITGTNGKSTTSTLIHNSISKGGEKSYLAGNIGVPLIGEVVDIPEDALVTAEISSFQLEAVSKFKPFIAVLTNITMDHIDRHGSFSEYKRAKSQIFMNQNKEDYAVLNYDDPVVMSLRDKISSQKLYFSRKKRVSRGAYFEDGWIKIINNKIEKKLFRWQDIPLKGVHNLENVLAVACVNLALDINHKSLYQTLLEFSPLHYRMQYVDTIKDIKFYNDSKGTNPDAVRASLESFNEPVVIIAGGTDKGLDFMPLAKSIKEYSYKAVLIGESRYKIASSLNLAGFDSYKIIDDLTLPGFKESIKEAFLMCPKGGVVLLSPSCASFDMFKRAEHRGEMFNKYVGELKVENE